MRPYPQASAFIIFGGGARRPSIERIPISWARSRITFFALAAIWISNRACQLLMQCVLGTPWHGNSTLQVLASCAGARETMSQQISELTQSSLSAGLISSRFCVREQAVYLLETDHFKSCDKLCNRRVALMVRCNALPRATQMGLHEAHHVSEFVIVDSRT